MNPLYSMLSSARRTGRAFALGPSVGVAVLFAAVLAGCQTPFPGVQPVGVNPAQANTERLDDNAAARDLALAQRLVQKGDYSQALPRLLSITANYPEADAAVEANYFLGLTYYQLDGYRDAERYFSEYLRLAPEGTYAQLSKDYLLGLGDPASFNERAIARLKDRLAEAQSKEESSPEELADQLRLAELYWRNGEYEEAGILYRKLVTLWPELEKDATIRQRVERAPDGSFVLLTPDELDRRYASANPVYLYGVNAYTSRKFLGHYNATTYDDTYHVTGRVKNRGEETLQDVEIIVTIFTSGSLILDTKTVNVGRLRSGEERPFSVRFSGIENIGNVGRYECVATFSP